MAEEKKSQDKQRSQEDKRNKRYRKIFHEKNSRYLDDMLTTEE
jgi:hypothetical protein